MAKRPGALDHRKPCFVNWHYLVLFLLERYNEPTMSAKNSTFVIIDGNAIIHRAYHAIPPLTTKDGTIVNAVYGFTSMLLKVLQDVRPTHIAVAFDVAGKTFRDDLYDKYKATRVKADQDLYDQIPLVYDMVNSFSIPIYTKEGYEADDVIGTAVTMVKTEKPEMDIVVVTGDMDMLQLVDDRVKVYELRKGLSDIVLFDRDKVKEKFGFGPERVVDYKALRGDTSDNIPGVKGIGEKTAKELIESFGGIDEIYGRIKKEEETMRKELRPAVFKKLVDDEVGARMSKELATIKCDVPDLGFSLHSTELTNITPDKAAESVRRFEFFSLLKRLSEVVGGKDASPGQKEEKKKRIVKKSLTIIEKRDFPGFLKKLLASTEIVCREVVSGTDVFSSELIGLVFGVGEKIYYVELAKMGKGAEEIFGVFTDPKRVLVGHDVKQLVKLLRVRGVTVTNRLFDVMIASYLINSSSRAHDLQSLVMRELGRELSVGADQGNLFGVNPAVAGEEADSLYALYRQFAKAFTAVADAKLFDEIEMRLIPVLAEMELAGVAVDTDMLKQLSTDIADEIEAVTKKIWKEAGEEFNVASSVQLRDVLFEKMKLPTDGVKKGKTGLSTAASELEKLRELHPIIPMIEEHRELAKIQNTYVDVLPTLINKKTGRIHTSFNQAVAATGRLSSSDPNLQNIPIRTELGREIRNTFIAAPGFSLISADYSQIELRIAASLAEDEKMLEIFRDKKDIHQATAAAIHHVPLEEVTREMRYAAKEINFGVLYGMGAYGLAWRAGIPQWQAKEFIQKYFEEFSGVKKYVDETLKFAKKNGYVETLYGRRRYIPELQASNFQLRSAGERMAVNMPIQGTAADLMKLAMISVYERLEKEYGVEFTDGVKMILQVHDEIVLEVREGLADEVAKRVKDAMEEVSTLKVPVEVHVGTGKRWGEIK